MPSIPKTKKIELLAKMLQKRFKGLPLPPERTVLEHLIYAAVLENASFEQADAAYAVLEHYFIDWNEIRVSTVRELADTFSMLPDPMAAGERVRHSLQGVFEKTYMFDLEELRKKGKTLGQAIEFLRAVPACSRFMVDYAAQVAFGGHFIPVDEASLRVFRLLGLAQVSKDGTTEEVPGLERAISKKDGHHFFLRLHHFAAVFFQEPESKELRALLKPIDLESLNRDWTPPVLVVPKATPKPTAQRLAPIVTLPFVPAEDDDFEEESVGTEAEFLPDDSPFRPTEREMPILNADVPSPAVGEKKHKEVKEKKKNADPPTMKSVAVEPTLPPKQAKPKKSEPVKTIAKPSPSAKTPEKKKPTVPVSIKKPGAKTIPSKAKVTPLKKAPNKKSPQKSKAAPPLHQKPTTLKAAKPTGSKQTGKPKKSSTRQLREKKPK